MRIPAVEQWAQRKEGVCVCNPAPDRVTLCRPRPVCPRPCGRATRHLRWPRGGAARNRTDHVIAANEQPTAWTSGQHRGRKHRLLKMFYIAFASVFYNREGFTHLHNQSAKAYVWQWNSKPKAELGPEEEENERGLRSSWRLGLLWERYLGGGGQARAVTKTESLLCGCHL